MRAARRSCWAAILAHGRAWLVAPRPDLATLDRILGLMQQRLTLMHEVARWKWNAGQPVMDAGRERELLHSVVERGRGKGFESKLVRPLPKNRRCARRCDRLRAQAEVPSARRTDTPN
jgi:chorismate mutase